LLDTPDRFFFGFTFPGKNRDALIFNGRRRMIVGLEDIA
jgi:hypothetical protein